MNKTNHQSRMSTRIGTGFVVVLVLMAALSAIGLRYVADANKRLKDIALNNNVKIELATEMHRALLERALSMHSLSILSDPFERDEEIQRFNEQGNLYIKARDQLESLPLNQQEQTTLAKILAQTRAAQPEVQAVVDMSRFTRNPTEIYDRIRTIAIPGQRAIAEQVSVLLDLQRQQTAAAVRDAETAYHDVRYLMLVLGSIALLVGVFIAWFVSRQVTHQARQLADQAMYDPLTGLANRTLLLDRLQHEIQLSRRMSRPFCVVLMDLDRFKEVNDTLGHDVGDEVLREVAYRLKQSVRAEDTVARLGGDEYVVLLHDYEPQGAEFIAHKLLASLEKPFHWKGQSIDLGASLGLSFYPNHSEDVTGLLRRADIAMYAAKRAGMGYALYNVDQEHTTLSDLSLKGELREAILANHLSLYYQPQINHHSQHIVGLEALVRWHHPQRGFLTPDKFIPLAEDAGLIMPLTQWVIKAALAQLHTLHRRGHMLNMAVNLSVKNLRETDLPARIQSILASSDIPARYLTLEIMESAVMSNPTEALAILTELDQMGVRLAIDDFGTGYSSLAYLKSLPVDELKIDKSFVTTMEENENDAVIVRSTIDLSHNLGLKVTAEGVEDHETWITLSVLGCDQSQGFFMGNPMPADELHTWLEESLYAAPPRNIVHLVGE